QGRVESFYAADTRRHRRCRRLPRGRDFAILASRSRRMSCARLAKRAGGMSRHNRCRLNTDETAVRKIPCHFPVKAHGREKDFPARRCRKEDKPMSKYLIEMCFLATGVIGLLPGCDFFPAFSRRQGKSEVREIGSGAAMAATVA